METVQNSLELELVGAIRDLISRLDRSLAHDLWDAEDIAIYMRLGRKSVQNHYLDKPNFPKPIILETGGRRWVATEVKAWVLRHR